MERAKKVEIIETLDDGVIRYKKIGGGSFKLRNRLIKPNEVFTARPDEIPVAFRDVVIALDAVKTPAPEVIKVSTPSYTIQPHGKSLTWFDVVRSDGKIMNEKGQKKEAAEQIIKDLEAL